MSWAPGITRAWIGSSSTPGRGPPWPSGIARLSPWAILEERNVLPCVSGSCNCLHLPDHCRFAAEREGGGLGWCVWRHGFADRLRPARFGHAAIESHHDLRCGFYGDVIDALDHGYAERGPRHVGVGRTNNEEGAGKDCAAQTGSSRASPGAGGPDERPGPAWHAPGPSQEIRS